MNICPDCRHLWSDHRDDGFCHFLIYRYERCHCTALRDKEATR